MNEAALAKLSDKMDSMAAAQSHILERMAVLEYKADRVVKAQDSVQADITALKMKAAQWGAIFGVVSGLIGSSIGPFVTRLLAGH